MKRNSVPEDAYTLTFSADTKRPHMGAFFCSQKSRISLRESPTQTRISLRKSPT